MLSRTAPVVFDTATMSLFSKRLLNCPQFKLKYKPQVREAAVLVPLCVVEGKPSVLFTVRNVNMNTHGGEISFPGGKEDPEDTSTEYTALRETEEEVGIKPSEIDILGCYSSLPNKTGSLRVHPYVGFIKSEKTELFNHFNPDEVSSVFTLPIDYLVDPKVREVKQFRDSKHKYTVFKVPDHIEGEKEIWGLTSFILDGKNEQIMYHEEMANDYIIIGVLRKIIPEHYT